MENWFDRFLKLYEAIILGGKFHFLKMLLNWFDRFLPAVMKLDEAMNVAGNLNYF